MNELVKQIHKQISPSESSESIPESEMSGETRITRFDWQRVWKWESASNKPILAGNAAVDEIADW